MDAAVATIPELSGTLTKCRRSISTSRSANATRGFELLCGLTSNPLDHSAFGQCDLDGGFDQIVHRFHGKVAEFAIHRVVRKHRTALIANTSSRHETLCI